MNERLRQGVVFGLAFLSFLAPLKFTQPVVLYHLIDWPKNGGEWFYSFWPNTIFYIMLFPLAMMGLRWSGWKETRKFVSLTPVIFLLVQLLSTLESVDQTLSLETFWLFCSLTIGYLLGARTIRNQNDLQWILFGWFLGSMIVVWSGITQATGGLEETRRFLYQHPELAKLQPDLWKKVESDRIFATLFYPNALGGYVVSAVFVVVAWCFHVETKTSFPLILKRLSWIVGILLVLGLLDCLWQSQSKGAYIVLFISIMLAVFLLVQQRKKAFILTGMIFILSILGFGLGYGKQAIEKGKKTWEARLGYWQAAWNIGWDHPLLGTGPGTFEKMYSHYKKPRDEDTRLVHNNYLQMWSDSGFLGWITFLIWLPGSLILWLYHHWKISPRNRVIQTLIWCACVAFALHSLIDFDLYMISNSWPIFILLGCSAAGRFQNHQDYAH